MDIVAEIKGMQSTLIALTTGSCNCATKSNQVRFHRKDCRYKLLAAAYDSLERIIKIEENK